MNSRCFILASRSPRRRELLQRAGFQFSVEAAEVGEADSSTHSDWSPCEMARFNAKQKAFAVAEKNIGRDVLAADTLVVCEGRTLGKPKDISEAREMLKWMSGKVHEVITAAVWVRFNKKNEGKPFLRESTTRTRVKFHDLDEKTISSYLSTVNVLDKAGAYALQEKGEWLIEHVEGSRSNVIGLPMEVMEKWLRRSA